MENLQFLTDNTLYLLELKQDILFHKIPKGKIQYYIEGARSMGRECSREYKGKNIRSILEKEGISVIVEKNSKGKSFGLRGEIVFSKKEKKIVIYEDSMEQLHASLKKYYKNIGLKKAYDIHLAHEFYHYLEYKNGKGTNELLDKIESIKLGPYTRKASILKTREIAAHSFCKEFLGLPFNPLIIDYIYLIETNETSIDAIKACICDIHYDSDKS